MPGPWSYRIEITNQVSQSRIRLNPPAPAFYVKISYRESHTTIPAKLDTGADLTAIPHATALLLQLRKIGERSVGGALDLSQMRPIFKANLDFLGFSIPDHPVVSLERKEYILIGRDIMNRYNAILNGPDLQFFLNNP